VFASLRQQHAEQTDSTCLNGPCYPGNEFCGKPFENAPKFHLMDQHGCGENDPNGPVFDPVHGVVHHFYQIRKHADCTTTVAW
jgi:sucrose-6-phosphate hydrolase SacC (GH32 family)